MIRGILSFCAFAALAACSNDGRGSAYSSARASQPAPSYIPVTPGAVPVGVGPSVTQAAATLPRTPAAPEPVLRFSTGPIYQACQSSGRKAASRERCGCVQWVADRELTAAQQRRGAGYFSDQHALQEVRQSSERIRDNGEFWQAWKAFGNSAAAQCNGT
jgi:hypothetical protein